MNEGVYGSFASKLSERLISAPSVHKVSLKDSQWISIHLLDTLIGTLWQYQVGLLLSTKLLHRFNKVLETSARLFGPH